MSDMSSSVRTVYSAAASREIDAFAIANLGVTGYALMQRAADAAFTCLLQHFPGAKSVSVWCGKGNNAGDAYLLARLAREYGMGVTLWAVVDPAELSGDAAKACAAAVAAGVTISKGMPDADDLTRDPSQVIVDGLLGTGLNGAPRPPFAAAIEKMNTAGAPVLAIDIPSGVSADTGAVFDQAVQATVTVSFITAKAGLYTGAGVSCAGVREFADLGVPKEMFVAAGIPLLRWSAAALPALDANTYKHRQGHVVVAGGDINMPGAVAMASAAALRVGAGMVTTLTHREHSAAIIARTPEVMVLDYDPAPAQADVAAQLLQHAQLVVLGPGLGRTAWSEDLYRLVERSGRPTLLDADGLFWLAQNGRWQGGDLTITPHVAEAARLLGMDAEQVQADRFSACQTLSARFACRGVLKGAGSLVFTRDELSLCVHGNPGMATAGMGDVLSGIAGGLLGQVVSADISSSDLAAMDQRLAAAVALHSAAADAAVLEVGERSLVATDVTAKLPALLLHSA